MDARKRKQTWDDYSNKNTIIDTVIDPDLLNHIKHRLNYSIGNIEINFEAKLPLIIMIVQNSINNCKNKNIMKDIYRELTLIIGKKFTTKNKKNDIHKINYCIVIITYELYIKAFPGKLNINSNKFNELYPNFLSYENEEQIKLFNFYKCVVIFKNIIQFRRNFGFIFDSSVLILEGCNKKYTRGGGANLETRNRSKILFDVYGEVKKPSMRHKKGIFNFNDLSDISSDEESNDDESDDCSSSDSSSCDEYICLKKMKVDFSIFDSRF
jgi:hypothetical protein